MARRPRIDRSSRNIGFKQRPFAEVRSPLRPAELISADQVEVIHHASLRVLRDVGLKVDSAVAVQLLAEIGADVDLSTQRVRFDPALIEEMLTDIPSEFVTAQVVHLGRSRLKRDLTESCGCESTCP